MELLQKEIQKENNYFEFLPRELNMIISYYFEKYNDFINLNNIKEFREFFSEEYYWKSLYTSQFGDFMKYIDPSNYSKKLNIYFMSSLYIRTMKSYNYTLNIINSDKLNKIKTFIFSVDGISSHILSILEKYDTPGFTLIDLGKIFSNDLLHIKIKMSISHKGYNIIFSNLMGVLIAHIFLNEEGFKGILFNIIFSGQFTISN